MDRPIFTTAAPGRLLAGHLEAATAALLRVLADPDVPEPSVVSMYGTTLGVSPWLSGAPITALLAWVRYLAEPTYTISVHKPLSNGSFSGTITARGQLYGVAAEVSASTWRQPHGVDPLVHTPQPITETAVRVLAAWEAGT